MPAPACTSTSNAPVPAPALRPASFIPVSVPFPTSGDAWPSLAGAADNQ
jgi:hypothetical protein